MKHSSLRVAFVWPPLLRLARQLLVVVSFVVMLVGVTLSGDKVALADEVILTSSRVDLGPAVSIWEDASANATFAEMSAFEDKRWQRLNAPMVNMGFVSSALWLQVSVQNPEPSNRALLLEQHYPLMDDMQVHWRCNSGIEQSYEAGDLKPWSARPVPSHVFLFPLQVGADDHCRLWLRAKNTEAMELPLILWDKDAYFDDNRNALVIDGVFLGFFAIMAVYNALLYFTVRDKSYLYYTVFVAAMFFFFASQQGYLYEWLFADSPFAHHYSIPFILALCVMFGALFFVEFLRLDQHTPRLAKAVFLLMWALAIAPITTFWLEYSISIAGIIVIISITSVLGLSGAIYLSFQNSHSAQILLTGWFVLVICVVFQTLSKLGALHNDFIAEYGLRIGTTIEIVIFSFALSYRINEERRAKEAALLAAQTERLEKLQAQDIALARERETREIKEQALEQQRRVNDQLEFMVHERTHELEDALNELERANRELQALSVKDALTNVFNRRFFNQKISEEWSRATRYQRPFALLMVDIDKFKRINDSWGHVCGDHVLTKVAALLKTVVCRPGDTISRYGGEEFAILLPETALEGAEKVAELLVQRVATELIQFNNLPIPVTISIGLAVFQYGAQDADIQSFVERADKALYHAKESGRNRYCIQ